MIYLFNICKIPIFDKAISNCKANSFEEKLKAVHDIKRDKSLEDLCTGRAQALK